MSWSARSLTARTVLVGVVCAMLSSGAQPAQAAWGTPVSVTMSEVVPSAAVVLWKPVPDASGYRVAYSTTSSWTDPHYLLTTDPRAELTGLEPGASYYVKVRVARPDGTNLGPYSTTLAVRPPTSSSYSLLSPIDVTAPTASASSVQLTWDARGAAERYRVQYSTRASMADARYVRVSGTRHTLTGLSPATRYWVAVRAIDAEGDSLSRYASPIQVVTAAASTVRAPTSLTVTSRANRSLAVSWKAASGAGTYRVKYASSSSWSGAKYLVVTGHSAELTGLSPSRTYYVKVRSVTTANRSISGYSSRLSARTRSVRDYPYLRPAAPAANPVGAVAATLTWPSRGSGLTYRVRYDSDAGYDSPAYAVVRTPRVVLSALSPNTRYSVSVRVVGSGNSPTLSEYSATVTVRTPTRAAPLRAASFNIRKHNSFSGYPNEGTWLQRRAAVAALVKKQAPDVLALQEAQQSRVRNADGTLSRTAQMEDLVARLGSPYKLANPHRYNCVKSTTMTRCVAKDREASRGVRIVYNSAEVELKRHGARRLSYVHADDMERYIAWAVFRHKDSGKDFMFASVHFENTHDLIPGSTLYQEIRKTQTRESLAELKAHNPDKLPVIFAGDLNSTKWTVPANAPYDILRAAGYVDPLGNTYRSTKIAAWATAEKRIRTEYNSYNRWNVQPSKSGYPNGSYFDYIFTSGRMRVSEWETAMTLNSDGSYAGVIPSDHHLVRATVWLP